MDVRNTSTVEAADTAIWEATKAMDVKIKWNGDNFEDALNKAAFAQVRDNVAKALRGARCSIHGKTPDRVEVTGRDLASLGWRVYGCCEGGLTAAAKRALA